MDTHRSGAWTEIGVEDWHKIIREQTDGPIIITGGEPWLYKGLLPLAMGIGRPLRINTHGRLVTLDDLKALAYRKHDTALRVTFQQSIWSVEAAKEWLRAVALPGRKLSGLRIIVNLLRDGANDGFTGPILSYARQQGLSGSRYNIAQRRGPRFPPAAADTGLVLCHRGCFFSFGPDGRRYCCVGNLHLRKHPVPAGFPRSGTVVCENYGACALCDRHGPIRIETYDGDLEPGVYPRIHD
jgi:hypothetical protein